ncbi:MAG: class I SAM-dependent methyltransferase [Myxococcota bacterium]
MDDEHRQGIRDAYADLGVAAYYEAYGASYRNPHEEIVRALVGQWLDLRGRPPSSALDLACGSGEVTLALLERGVPREHLVAADPYTRDAYAERTGRAALPYTFEDIARGALCARTVDVVVCSFALHLADKSWLPTITWRLAELAPELVVITPNKRPELDPRWGFALEREWIRARIRCRVYSRVDERSG